MLKRTEIYTNGQYLQLHPGWDGEDAVLKSGWIRQMINKHSLPVGEVVEVGCGSGRILSELSSHYKSSRFKGYEISPEALNIAKQFANERIELYEQELPGTTSPADLLLLIDVLEHVPDYYGLLENLRPAAKHFIFHIPLDLSRRSLMKPQLLLNERESSGHIHYFSKEMVLWMLRDTGYTVMDWWYTKPMCDLQRTNGLKATTKKTIRNLSFNLSKEKAVKWWGGYSMLIAAKPI